MKISLRTLALILMFLISKSLMAASLPNDYLIAISLSAALQKSNKSLWITNPIAIICDNNGDAIIVGKRKKGLQPLTIDDIALSLKVRKFKTISESPGVSIEPPELEQEKPFIRFSFRPEEMVVRYIGGIENTSLGLLFFQTDLLLKLLGMGYENSGIYGLPNEWDIDIHQKKRGKRISIWDDEPTPSFFFANIVEVVPGNMSIALSDINIKVMVGEKDRFHTILLNSGVNSESIKALRKITLYEVISRPKEEIREKIKKSLSDNNELEIVFKAVEFVKKRASKGKLKLGDLEMSMFEINDISSQSTFAKLLSNNMQKLKEKYPILQTYESRLALLALMRQIDTLEISKNLIDNIENRKMKSIYTPTHIPNIQRKTLGLCYSYGVTGRLSFLVEDAKDGSPDAIRDLVLFHRPRLPKTLVWITPLIPGSDKKRFITNNNQAKLQKLLDHTQPTVNNGISINLDLDEDFSWKGWYMKHIPKKPIKTSGWSVDTHGDNLDEISGKLSLGIRNSEFVRADQLYPSVPKEIFGFSYDLSFKTVYRNNLLLSVSVPFDAKLMQVPATNNNLPDLYNFVAIAGISNPVIKTSYLLYSEIYKSPIHWITLDANYVLPFSLPLAEDDFAPIGIDGSLLYLGPTASIRFNNNWNFRTSLYKVSGSYNQPTNQKVSGGWGRWIIKDVEINESSWYFSFNPSVRVNSKLFHTLGINFISVAKEKNTTKTYEIYTEIPYDDRSSRLTAGLSYFVDDPYYYFSWSMPFDFGSFKVRKWSEGSVSEVINALLE